MVNELALSPVKKPREGRCKTEEIVFWKFLSVTFGVMLCFEWDTFCVSAGFMVQNRLLSNNSPDLWVNQIVQVLH